MTISAEEHDDSHQEVGIIPQPASDAAKPEHAEVVEEDAIAPEEENQQDSRLRRVAYRAMQVAVLVGVLVGLNYMVHRRSFREQIFDVYNLRSLDIPTDTPANRMLAGIPRKLPGTWSISNADIIATPGAKHLLIHIRQIHANPFFDSPPERIQQLSQVQEQIYGLLCHLFDQHDLRTLYPEGVATENAAQIYKVDREFSDMVRRLREGQDSSEGRPVLSQRAERRYDFSKVSAVRAFTLERQVNVRRAEDETLRAQALDHFFLGQGDHQEIVMDGREDVLLSIIAEDGTACSITVYGAQHDWKDNVAKWNADPANAQQKFSLLVITPQSLPE